MKKILFFIAMVAMIAAMASAQVAVSVSGSVTTDFGLDLDRMDTGFEGSGSATATVSFDVDPTSASSAVEDGDTVYGEFSVGDIALSADTSAASADLALAIGSPSAKIVIGMLTINMGGASDAASESVGFNGAINNAYNYAFYDTTYGEGDTLASDNGDGQFVPAGLTDTLEGNKGLELVLDVPDIMSIAIDVESRDTWQVNDAADLTDNEYAFRAGIDLTAVENLSFSAGINFANYDPDENIAFGASVGYTIAIGEEDSITPSAGFTYMTDLNGSMGISGGINASVAGLVVTVNAGMVDPDVTAADDAVLNLTVAADLGGLVDGLTTQVACELVDLLAVGVPTMGIHGKVGYAVAAGDLTITPTAEVSYFDNDTATADLDLLYAKIDINVAGLIDNTTFNLGWDSNDLLDNYNTTPTETMGQLVLSTTVSL